MFYQNSFKFKIGLFVGIWVSSDRLITHIITNHKWLEEKIANWNPC
jgi:hypothetical protein